MSIAGSLSSALSGLTANARAAEIISSNIANAMTEGYGRREIVLTSRQVGGVAQGVVVVGVYRHADHALIGDRRLAESSAGHNQVKSEFLSRLERVLGTPGDEQSLTGRIAAFDTALIEASSRPESEARLSRVADTAKALTTHLSDVSKDIQSARARADDRIEADVTKLNNALTRVGELNKIILANAGTGRESSALMDQRQQLIDQVAEIVPLREFAREGGVIALVTESGTTLVDGQVAQFGFTPVGYIVPGMTVESGALSGLTLNGKAISTDSETGPIAGGTLAANFAIRDTLGIEAQAQVDALARDLVDRFDSPELALTTGNRRFGWFTDDGRPQNARRELGLSQRIELNAAADPERGGALWRLRDGLDANAPGPTGDARLLNVAQAALTERRNPSSPTFMDGERSLSTLASDMLSGIAARRLTAEGEASYSAARADGLRAMELQGGVDSDQEIQSLLLIEQNYAANAKVVQTVDEMIKLLLGM
ncbi:MAG: flagellar hook-associated protein FlgK [Paracoccaceae bacterium]